MPEGGEGPNMKHGSRTGDLDANRDPGKNPPLREGRSRPRSGSRTRRFATRVRSRWRRPAPVESGESPVCVSRHIGSRSVEISQTHRAQSVSAAVSLPRVFDRLAQRVLVIGTCSGIPYTAQVEENSHRPIGARGSTVSLQYLHLVRPHGQERKRMELFPPDSLQWTPPIALALCQSLSVRSLKIGRAHV